MSNEFSKKDLDECRNTAEELLKNESAYLQELDFLLDTCAPILLKPRGHTFILSCKSVNNYDRKDVEEVLKNLRLEGSKKTV